MEIDGIECVVKGWFSKRAVASKKALEVAGGKVQNFADKEVVKLEKRQLQNKRERKYKELGKRISLVLDSGTKLNIKKESDKVAIDAIQAEIKDITFQISEKEKELD